MLQRAAVATAFRCKMTVRRTASASARLLMRLALREALLQLLLLLYLELLQLVYLLHSQRRRGVLLVLHTLSPTCYDMIEK